MQKEEESKRKEAQELSKLQAVTYSKDEKIQFLENEVRSFRDRVLSERES